MIGVDAGQVGCLTSTSVALSHTNNLTSDELGNQGV